MRFVGRANVQRLGGILLLFASCKSSCSAPSDATSSLETVAVPSVSAPTGQASAAPSSSAAAPTLLTIEGERAAVARWNEALNAGDTRTLRTIYAPSVLYYGTKLDGATCVARIAAALERVPGYHQDIKIKSVTEDEWDVERATVFFTKRNGGIQYDAYSVVDRYTSKILEESDATTDANLVKRGVCFSYDSNVTLTGTLSAGMHLAGDEVVSDVSLDLDKPVCVIERVDIRFDDAGNERYDGPVQPPRIDRASVHVVTADSATDISTAWTGKRVTVKGRFSGRAMRDFTNLHLTAETIGGPTPSRAQ